MTKKTHKAAIINALRQKQFSKRSATNIAKAILKKAKSKDYVTDWSKSVSADLKAAAKARYAVDRLNDRAAINKSTMAGQIVVVTRK